MDSDSLMTDDEKIRVKQLLEEDGEENVEPNVYNVDAELQKELNKIEEKLKEFKVDKITKAESSNVQYNDFHLSQRLGEIDEHLKGLANQSLMKKKTEEKEPTEALAMLEETEKTNEQSLQNTEEIDSNKKTIDNKEQSEKQEEDSSDSAKIEIKEHDNVKLE